ncbi:MAG: hypothetical protein ACPGLV_03455 [Bacteroidia bacterium]
MYNRLTELEFKSLRPHVVNEMLSIGRDLNPNLLKKFIGQWVAELG